MTFQESQTLTLYKGKAFAVCITKIQKVWRGWLTSLFLRNWIAQADLNPPKIPFGSNDLSHSASFAWESTCLQGIRSQNLRRKDLKACFFTCRWAHWWVKALTIHLFRFVNWHSLHFPPASALRQYPRWQTPLSIAPVILYRTKWWTFWNRQLK